QTDYSNISYFYNGKDYTYCINSEQELKKFVFYAVLYRLETAEVYINFDYSGKQNAYSSTQSLIQNMLPTISKYGVDINSGDVLGQLFSEDNLQNLTEILSFIEEVHDQIYLYYDVTSNLTSQKSNCVYTLNFEYVGDYEATVSDNNSQIGTSNSSTRTFAIDSLASAPVETVAQLLMVVQNGRKPEFVTTSKTKDTLINGKTIAEQTYIKARQVLNKICTDSMTDYQKALAIYNWIVVNNQYDYNTCGSAEGAPFSSENLSKMSFYASGTLLNNLSVCKGIAQAFGLMCNIEGIKAVETFGIVGSGIDWANVDFKTMSLATYNLLMNIDAIGAHSWNRVYLDAGEGKQWYVVDATWEEKVGNDFSAHDYFLINDSAIKDNRKEFYPCGQFYFETDAEGGVIDFSANGSYNYYADTNINALITSQTQLNDVVASMILNGGSGFEVIFDSSIIGNYATMINQALTQNSLNYDDYAVYKKDNYVLVYKK
ncbi:MAG: transglutaminase domain-containing protein, partial [Christensenellales bacterium]